MARRRGEVEPHVCPNSDGFYRTVTVAGLRAAGCKAEADRLDHALRQRRVAGGHVDENATALSLFGCCQHDRLGRLSGSSPVPEEPTDG